MTAPLYKNSEPLFTVIMRDPSARNLFTQWIATSKSINARAEENRLHIFDHNTMSLFMVTWAHDWDRVMIWDVWAKRHIYI
jgi:hypothetical protein